MINIYKTNTKTGVTENESIISKGCWINLINPDENEIERVCRETDISDRFISSQTNSRSCEVIGKNVI